MFFTTACTLFARIGKVRSAASRRVCAQVRSLELGSNTSIEGKSRDHSLGLMVTFAGHAQRQAYLRSAERAEFASFIEPFVRETFVFDFESGGVEM